MHQHLPLLQLEDACGQQQPFSRCRSQLRHLYGELGDQRLVNGVDVLQFRELQIRTIRQPIADFIFDVLLAALFIAVQIVKAMDQRLLPAKCDFNFALSGSIGSQLEPRYSYGQRLVRIRLRSLGEGGVARGELPDTGNIRALPMHESEWTRLRPWIQKYLLPATQIHDRDLAVQLVRIGNLFGEKELVARRDFHRIRLQARCSRCGDI